ncbi:MAG TPA: polyprenyl diphosphate synthase [Candidatus Bathyarchaeia archaeon]|nr:polyprenyl diphosphate synthase [Candidatus Bathyarchaeia archaeon]
MSWIRENAHNSLYKAYERLLVREVTSAAMPKHVAIIQDGNRRYADKIGEPRTLGHVYGALTTERVLWWCLDLGIEQLTLYAFSTENYARSKDELGPLFSLIEQRFADLYGEEQIYQKEVQVRMVGERQLLPDGVLRSVERVEEATRNFKKHSLNFALAYGGRKEIVDVVRSLAQLVENNSLSVDEIDEDMLAELFYSNNALTDVDLIIRSGGEERTSNFLPWQANGNECCSYFCAPYWPEFRRIDLLRAIRTFQEKERERKISVVQRAFTFLNEIGKVEAGEVFKLSRKACVITYEEVKEILRDFTPGILANND